MPIFEYICRDCEHQFESDRPRRQQGRCPSCKSKRLEKQLSVFAAATKDDRFPGPELPATPCGSCGDPRGPGSCSLN